MIHIFPFKIKQALRVCKSVGEFIPIVESMSNNHEDLDPRINVNFNIFLRLYYER